jgi:hypothetical protein
MQVLEGRTATDEWNMPPEADMRKDVLLPTSSCIMFYIVLLSLSRLEYEVSSPVLLYRKIIT